MCPPREQLSAIPTAGLSPRLRRPERRGLRVWSIAALLGVLTACTASRYEVLSFFFDGVPDPSAPPKVRADDQPHQRFLPIRPVEAPPVVVHTHQPYLQRRCEECHKGAGDKNRRSAGSFAINTMSELLLPTDRLCWKCHKPVEAPYQHAPALVGNCVVCHAAHSSRFPHLVLEENTTKLCERCHTDSTMPTREKHAGYGDKDCTECHDPHASGTRFLLRDPAQGTPPSFAPKADPMPAPTDPKTAPTDPKANQNAASKNDPKQQKGGG